MLDYIIIGAGLSGIAVAEELLSLGKTIRIFENGSQASSTVAGGIYNPVILKRFTLAWEADNQLKTAIPFYRGIEQKLDISIVEDMPIYRRFHSIEEQNDWFSAMDKPALSQFLSPHLVQDLNPCIPGEFSFGKVEHTGIVQTEILLERYRIYLASLGSLISESFEYDKLQLRDNKFHYKGFQAERIVFCEGFGMTKNPFFNYLPLTGNKGEYLIIESTELQLKVSVKSSVFILPQGNNLYKVGATYNNYDKSAETTEEAREYLLQKLKSMLNCSFQIVDQVAGIRPATRDRKPFVGEHPEYKNLFICNGFGSRGVLIAPTVAKELVAHLETKLPINPEIDIRRFRKN